MAEVYAEIIPFFFFFNLHSKVFLHWIKCIELFRRTGNSYRRNDQM